MENIIARKGAGVTPKKKAKKVKSRQNKQAERRQYPRINTRVPLTIAADGYDFITTTQNVSCVGAYCCVNKYIPPFTKINVKLSLPVAAGNQKNGCAVECKGVIVRSEDENGGGFNIAIFFNEIGDNQRKKIAQYLKRFLPQ